MHRLIHKVNFETTQEMKTLDRPNVRTNKRSHDSKNENSTDRTTEIDHERPNKLIKDCSAHRSLSIASRFLTKRTLVNTFRTTNPKKNPPKLFTIHTIHIHNHLLFHHIVRRCRPKKNSFRPPRPALRCQA